MLAKAGGIDRKTVGLGHELAVTREKIDQLCSGHVLCRAGEESCGGAEAGSNRGDERFAGVALLGFADHGDHIVTVDGSRRKRVGHGTCGLEVQWDGAEHFEAAMQAGKGVIIMSPHLGSWEIGAQAIAEKFGPRHGPMVVLFRPARKAWLEPLVANARTRPYLDSAPTSLAGVRALIRTLRQGGYTAILPDQVPPQGQGVWAPFFGRDVLSSDDDANFAIIIYNKKRYGIVSGSQLVVLIETGETLAYERSNVNASWLPVTVSPQHQEISRNARALLGAAEKLLISGCYNTVAHSNNVKQSV